VARLLTRILLGGCGLLMLGLGAYTLAGDAGTSGSIAPIVAGVVLLLSPFLLDRADELLIARQAGKQRLTQTLRELGTPGLARIFERTDLARVADSYGFIHHALSDSQYRAARVHLQDTLTARASEMAMVHSFDGAEVRKVFRQGPPVLRTLALGLMSGDISLADNQTVLAAVAEAHAPEEQYHALVLAGRIWPRLGQEERHRVLDAGRKEPAGVPHPARTRLVEELATRLIENPGLGVID
jgi:hypothetical protein